MQTACQLVEITKTRGDACNGPLVFKELLDRFESAHHLLFHREHLTFDAILAYREDSLLHLIEQIVHFLLLLEGASHALRGSRDDLAKDVFVANDIEVIADVGRCWHESEKTRDEGCAADRVEQVPITQHLGERD